MSSLSVDHSSLAFSDREMKKIQIMMRLADDIRSLSTCSRRAVGAVITNSRYEILGIGYNGAAFGEPHCIDTNPEKEKSLCSCLHAEQNAVRNSRCDFNLERKKYALYAFVTTFPCPRCMETLHKAGISKVFFYHAYRYMEETLRYMETYGIDIQTIACPWGGIE